MTVWSVVLIVAMATWLTTAHRNLLLNPRFDEDLSGTWDSNGFTMEQVRIEDGSTALRCSGRTQDIKGPSQVLPRLTPGRGYEFRAAVRLLNGNPRKLFQSFKATVAFNFVESPPSEENLAPASSIPPNCKGKTGVELEECQEVRAAWAEEERQKQEEEKRKKLEQKERERQELEAQKLREKEEKEEEKAREKQEAEEQRQREKDQKAREKQELAEQKEREKQEKQAQKQREKEMQNAEKQRQKEEQEQQRQREKEQQALEKERQKQEKELQKQREKQLKQEQKQREKELKQQEKAKRTAEQQRKKELKEIEKQNKKAERDAEKQTKKEQKRRKRQAGMQELEEMRKRKQIKRQARREIILSERSLKMQQKLKEKKRGLEAQAETVRRTSKKATQVQSRRGAERARASGTRTSSDTTNVTETTGAYIIAYRAWVTPDQGWLILTGSINAPMLAFNQSTLSIRGPDAGCDFLLANVSFYEVPERADWLAESHAMIDTHRKSDVRFTVDVPASVNSSDIDVQVRLKRHLFAFGAKVEDDMIRNRFTQNFRDLFYNLFNWATLGSFKWKFNKGSLFSPDFSNALEALDILRANNIKVRAHSILWGVEKNVPDDVLAYPVEDLPDLVSFHTQYMVNITKGKVEQWDVQNEYTHGHWYEETLRDPHFTEKVFKEARGLDPKPKLYLNDFTAVTSGANTEDLYDTAMRFIQAGTGIGGLGIQGHTKDFVKPDPTMMWRRLDRLAETGLELFMTEFDLGWNDDVVRADWFEDAMRAFFAHPGLSGVIQWGIWREKQRYRNKYLVYGENYTFAEQGHRYACLVKKEWTTNETFNMAENNSFSLRAFQGDYEVLVKRGGVPVQRETFTLGKESKDVNIVVTDSSVPIEVQEEHDYVPQCISHRDRKSLGIVQSQSSDTRLLCRDHTTTVASGLEANITCDEGEIMTTCQSRPTLSRLWQGEVITVDNDVPSCSAAASNQGDVELQARCCRQSDLWCDYRQAGPSNHMTGALAEAVCPLGYAALGCGGFSQHADVTGAYPGEQLTSCLAKRGPARSQDPALQSGVVARATCCIGPQLSCQEVTSPPSGGADSDVSVTCDVNDVMTGCHAIGEGNVGTIMHTDANGRMTCTAGREGGLADQLTSVVAVAVCCENPSP